MIIGKTNKTILMMALLAVITILSACNALVTPSGSTPECTEPLSERETESEINESETEQMVETAISESKEQRPIEEDHNGMERFFGKWMPKKIEDVNKKTLANPTSMLFDLTSDLRFTVSDVLVRINAYTIPDSGSLDGIPIDLVAREEIRKSCNFDVLTARITDPNDDAVVEPKYGILVTNADVRSFPTHARYNKLGSSPDIDYFQETKLPFASGVLVLHSSLDGKYSFCQGEYYSGWIGNEDIAITDKDAFIKYMTPERFAVALGTDRSVDWNRMGLLIPVRSVSEDVVTLLLPKRNEDGGLSFYTRDISLTSGSYSLGFLEYSPGLATEMIEGMIGTPYGWGDENGYYDCSGINVALFRCFGYFLPRNSSIMSSYGGVNIDMSAMSHEEKVNVVRKYRGCVISWPGHAIFFKGINVVDEEERFEIVQEGTGYFTKSGELIETFSATLEDANEIYRGNGMSFLDSVQTLIVPGIEGLD